MDCIKIFYTSNGIVYKMIPIIVGFSGKRASGKSTLAKRVANRISSHYLSFGDYVRAEASNRGLIDSIPNLQIIGEELMKYPLDFCKNILCSWNQNENLVIDGIRHEIILNCLREIISPSKLYLIYIMTDEANRISRLQNRGESLRDSNSFDSHSTEQDVKNKLIICADLIVDNSQTEDSSFDCIVNFLKGVYPRLS
jgi:dephospho-CoA kinase